MQRSRATVAVIGAGPGGIAATQQCKREGLDDVILVERGQPGGLLYHANLLENFPGLRGATGREAVVELGEILMDYGITIMKADVTNISMAKKGFRTVSAHGPEVISKYLVLATGTGPRKLGIPGEICEPEWRDYTGERVAVVGGGDAAYDYALRLNELGAKVIIFRRNEPRALNALVDEVRLEGIEEICHEITDWQRSHDLYTLRYGENTLSCDMVVTAVGREPALPAMDFVYHGCEFPTGATDVENLYAVGSLVLRGYRHATLAWGMGLAAAMDICGKEMGVRKE